MTSEELPGAPDTLVDFHTGGRAGPFRRPGSLSPDADERLSSGLRHLFLGVVSRFPLEDVSSRSTRALSAREIPSNLEGSSLFSKLSARLTSRARKRAGKLAASVLQAASPRLCHADFL